MSRKPASAEYDATVGLEPKQKGEIPTFAYALVKITYEVVNGRARQIEPEPLALDLYGEEPLSPPVPSGSDFWVSKSATDVVIQGSAFAPGGRPIPSMEVVARVGPLSKRIAVFGRREIVWLGAGRIQVPRAEPFAEMPLAYTNAYGGVDPRVPIPEEGREEYMQYASIGMHLEVHDGIRQH